MPDATRCVLDATALIAYLFDERGGGTIERLIDAGGSMVSTVNLSEVLQFARRRGVEGVSLLPGRLQALGVGFEPFTIEDAEYVADLAQRDPRRVLSLADRACLALGYRLDLPVVTDDGGLQPFGNVQLFR